MDSDLIVSFVEITGAEPPLAEKYLTVCDGVVETAVAMYFETGGADLVAEIPPRAVLNDSNPSMNVSTGIQDDDLVAFGDFRRQTREVTEFIPPVFNVDSDEEIMSEEEEDLNEDVGSSSPVLPSAPAALVRETASTFSNNDLSHLDEIIGSRSTLRRGREIDDATTARDNPFIRIERQMLDMAFKGSFLSARDLAKRDGKLLLVTVYEETEFPCFTLNRDLLTLQSIKEFINENFIFLYLSTKTSEGKRHLTFYPVNGYPYLGVIEPLTGERVKTWHFVLAEAEFMQEAYELIERHSSMLERSKKQDVSMVSSNVSPRIVL